MAKTFEIYKCEICGNIVEVLHRGKGALVYCGQPMVAQTENTVDTAQEKHLPVIEKTDQGVTVKIGSQPHPMTEAHHIEWIQLISPDGKYSPRHYLNSEQDPETTFKMKFDHIKARAYCSLHGLWSAEV